MIKIGFFTGARSDYGLTKKLIKSLYMIHFEVKILFWNALTSRIWKFYKEILDDDFRICKKINTYHNSKIK